MNYLVIELQTTNGTTANIVKQYSDLNSAESAYYSTCSSAVISTVDTHAVVLMNENGITLKNERFIHKEQNNEEV